MCMRTTFPTDEEWIEEYRFVFDAIIDRKEIDLFNDDISKWERKIPTGIDTYRRIIVSQECRYKLARPISSMMQRYLKPVDMMEWLVENGWKVEGNYWCKGKGNNVDEPVFTMGMWKYCGCPVGNNGFTWLPEWIEEVEVEE